MKTEKITASSIARMALLSGILAAGGCATIRQPLRDDLASTQPSVQNCANWIHRVDTAINHAGVRDAEPWRVPGFPCLRLDRFTASFVPQSKDNRALFDAWTARARDLNRAARAIELQNLPAPYWRPCKWTRAGTQPHVRRIARHDSRSMILPVRPRAHA